MMTMSKPLKILVVLPIYGGSLPIGQYCVEALKALGHRVEVFEAPDFQSTQLALGSLKVSAEKNNFLQNTLANLLSEAVYAQAEKFHPNLVLALAQAPLTRAVLKRFERDKIPTAMWFVEDYNLFTYWRSYANLYKHFFVIQKEPFLTLLREGGHESAHYLPLAALPMFHKKMELSPEEKSFFGADVGFLGAGYANRRQEFRKLHGFDLKIWGSDWDGETILRPYIQNNGLRINPADSVKIYNATKINLNLHSSVHVDKTTMGDFVNPRTFELASMGAFQLVDRRSLMHELFEIDGEDKELATFSKFDEVPDLIRYYVDHPEEREAISKRAVQRILKDHTYQQRMHHLLDIVAPSCAVNEALDEYLKDLPEDLRRSFIELCDKYDLSPDVSFDELLTSIRLETGKLEPLESSILFLAEWHKQYS